VYVYPSRNPHWQAEVVLWLGRQWAHLDAMLFDAVSAWLHTRWPLRTVAFPGRDVSWAAFDP
jgi:hypothetical protein